MSCAEESTDVGQSQSAPVILVVEDDESTRAVMEEALTLEGYQVRTAEHGQAALALLALGIQPAVIVTDIRMPVMDGQAFIRALAADYHPIPLLITAASSSISEWAEDLGVTDWLSKPFELNDFLTRIAQLSRVASTV